MDGEIRDNAAPSIGLVVGAGTLAVACSSALVELDPKLLRFETSDEALKHASGTLRLWIFEHGGCGRDAHAFARALRGRSGDPPPSPVLALLSRNQNSTDPTVGFGPDSDVVHWLAPPLSMKTLIAICRHLLHGQTGIAEHSAASADHETRRARPVRLGSNRPYDQASNYVERVLSAVEAKRPIPVTEGRVIAEQMYTNLLQSNLLVVKALEPHQTYDLAAHSVNVAAIACKLAIGLAMGPEDTIQVIHAGLVHDLGMACLPRELLGKAGRYSENDMEMVRRHPELGAARIAEAGPGFEWLQRVVLQEHERARGQGYPLGLSGSGIDPLAEIIGVADVFEALSHPRTYRSPFTALDALEQISDMQAEYFAPGVVAALINEISSFPRDSFVQLSTGEIGQVTGSNPSNMLRPVVLIQWDSQWTALDRPVELDLLEAPEVTIARSLLDHEVPIT